MLPGQDRQQWHDERAPLLGPSCRGNRRDGKETGTTSAGPTPATPVPGVPASLPGEACDQTRPSMQSTGPDERPRRELHYTSVAMTPMPTAWLDSCRERECSSLLSVPERAGDRLGDLERRPWLPGGGRAPEPRRVPHEEDNRDQGEAEQG